MDSTREEKSYFLRITSVIRLPEAEIIEPNALSLDVIQQVLHLNLFFPTFFFLFAIK